jgi:hypothetical protein
VGHGPASVVGGAGREEGRRRACGEARGLAPLGSRGLLVAARRDEWSGPLGL